jgi:predicted DNA-binding protein
MIVKGGVCVDKTQTQISFRVTNEFKERLEAQAQKERRSVASMVRIVMEDYLTEKENEGK